MKKVVHLALYSCFLSSFTTPSRSFAEVGWVQKSCKGVKSSYIENPQSDFTTLVHQKGNIIIIESCGKNRKASNNILSCRVVQASTVPSLCEMEKKRNKSRSTANSIGDFIIGGVVTGGVNIIGATMSANSTIKSLKSLNNCIGTELLRILNDRSKHAYLEQFLLSFFEAQQKASSSYFSLRALSLDTEDKREGFLARRLSQVFGNPNQFKDIPPYHYTLKKGKNSGIKNDSRNKNKFCRMFSPSFLESRSQSNKSLYPTFRSIN